MGTKTAEYNLKINTILDSAQKELDDFRNSFGDLWKNGQPPKALLRSYEDLRARLASLRQISEKGVVDFSDLKQATSDYKDFQKVVRGLGIEFKLFTEEQKKALFSSEEQASFEARKKAIDDYTKALKKNQDTLKQRQQFEGELEKEQAILKTKKTDRDDAKTKVQNLKENGPSNLSKDAQQFLQNQKESLEITKEIQQLQKTIQSEEAKGAKETGKNKLSRAKTTLEEKKKQLEGLDLETGKADYTEALNKHSELLKQAEEDWKNYSNEVEESEDKIKKINTQLSKLNVSDAQEDFDALKQTLKDLGVEGVDGAKDLEQIKTILKSLESEALAKVDKSLQSTIQHLEKLGVSGAHMKKEIDLGTESIKQQNTALADQQALESRIKAFFGLQGATQLFRSALRDAMQTISELDATMTEMSVVTDLTVGDYWDQLPEYSKRASELGVSINSAYKAATLYYQQGLKTNEVNAISVETLKMAKIANMDAAEATNKMTAALRGFNMELNQTSAQRVSDVYSELAAITAADTNEIANAMTKTASIAYSAGMEFETTAAFLSQIIETTRESAETAGTAMKTVIARFQELKKAPDEIGEIDGEIVDANAIETALRSVGVSLRDAKGQFRKLDDVFLELSSKWGDLDKNTQRYIATIAAGSRQQSRFIAMMQDYGRTQELVDAANNSAGASNRQFQKTVESLEAKVEKLKNAWHEFTMGIMNSDFVKFGIDILTKFLEVINKVTQGFGSFTGSISKIGGVLAMFKVGKAIFEKLKKPIVGFFVDVVDGSRKAGEDSAKAFAQAARDTAKDEKSKEEEEKVPKFGVAMNKTGGIAGVSAEGTNRAKNAIGNLGIGIINKTGVGGVLAGTSRLASVRDTRAKIKEKFGNTTREQLVRNYADANDQLKEAEMIGQKGGKRSPEKGGKQKAINAATEAQTKAKKELEEYDVLTKKVETDSTEGWKAITGGIEQASTALVAGGVAIGMLGQAFTDAGAEEFGETLSTIGSTMTLVGSILGFLVPVINLLQPAFAGAGTAGTVSGSATSAAWGVVGVIVMAVMAAILVTIAIVLLVLKALNDASPEKKLEDTQKAAEEAAKAANDAAEAYNNLANALDDLEDKYDALDQLTKGTKEWQKAVREVNSSVLDLIAQYPELAKFLENTDGVLRLDIESDGVQNVLKEAEERAIVAANDEMMAKVAVQEAINSVTASELYDSGLSLISRKKEMSIIRGKVGSSAQTGAEHGFLAGAPGGPVAAAPTAIGGATVGAIKGGIESSSTLEKVNEERMEILAQKMSSGELQTETEIREYIEEAGYAVGDEAIAMASKLAADSGSLIEFGQSLDATKEQQMAAFDAIAQSAQSLANTLSFTEEQLKYSQTLVDGDLAKTFYDEMYEKVSGEDFIDWDLNDYEGEYKDELMNALRKKYGDSVRLGEDGEVHFRDAEGKDATATFTNEELARLIATEYATEQSKLAIEGAPRAAMEMTKAIAGTNAEAYSAANKIFLEENGGELTRSDIATIKDSLGTNKVDFLSEWSKLTETQKETKEDIPQEIQTMWESLDDTVQAVFGNDIKVWLDKFSEGLIGASNALDNAKDVTWSFVKSSQAKNMQEKLDAVADKFGNDDSIKKTITDSINDFLGIAITEAGETYSGDLTEGTRQQALTLIQNADWSSYEDLLALQIQLEQELGFSTAEIEALTSTLGEAAFATSRLVTTVDVYGEVWQASQKLNQSMMKMIELQWDYNQALKTGGKNIGKLISQQIEEYKKQSDLYRQTYEGSKVNLEKLYAQGKFDYSIDLTKFVKLGERGLDVDQSEISKAVNSGLIKQEEVDKFLDPLIEEYNTQNEALEGMRESVDGIQALQEESKEAYIELRELAESAIIDSLQKQIDLEEENLDATKEANSKLINKLQEQIDATRQREQNKETEQNIADLQAKQGYLAMDTSGANVLAQMDLQNEIDQMQKDYENTLVDQAIQSLQDANAKAEEQRERQISLSQSQLDTLTESKEFQDRIDQELESMLNGEMDWKESNLGEMLQNQLTGMSSQDLKEWYTNTDTLVSSATSYINENWEDAEGTTRDNIKQITEDIASLPEEIQSGANARAITNQVTKLSEAGFDAESLLGFTMEENGSISYGSGSQSSVESGLRNLEKVVTADSDETQIKELQSSLSKKSDLAKDYGETGQKAFFDAVMSRDTFYEKYAKDLATSGEAKVKIGETEQDVGSYTDYLTRYDAFEVDGITNLSPREAFGGIALEGDKWYLDWEGGTGEDFDARVNGVEEDDVELGNKVSHQPTIKRLDYIWEQTGGEGKPYVILEKDIGGVSSNQLCIRQGAGHWWFVRNEDNEVGDDGKTTPTKLIDAGIDALDSSDLTKRYTKFKYETGGLADFTGPAWLDGTPSKPEYILNAAQTERFFSLVDVLEGFNKDKISDKTSGDNYFDININVDKLENDYDVEQIANKIRSMIYEDATYRNVNAINHIR